MINTILRYCCGLKSYNTKGQNSTMSELHENSNKRLELTKKRKMVGPNPLKRFKPTTHEGIGLRAHETKGRKKPNLPRSENLKGVQ